MTAPKKTTEKKTTTVEAVDTPVVTEEEPIIQERHIAEPGDRFHTENFSGWVEEKLGRITVSVAPKGWVGPAPLLISRDRMSEVRDLLNKLLGE